MNFSTQNVLQNMNKSVILLPWNNNRQEHKTTARVNIQNIKSRFFTIFTYILLILEEKFMDL